MIKETGGTGAKVSDEEILDAIQLLASTEGIFTEPAGGTTLAATRQLDRARRHQVARVGRRLHHRQRLQDGRGDARPRRQAGRRLVAVWPTSSVRSDPSAEDTGVEGNRLGLNPPSPRLRRTSASLARRATMYPVFLKLTGRPVRRGGRWTGGGDASSRDCSPRAHGSRWSRRRSRPRWSARGSRVHRRPFEERDLDGAWWVVAAAPPEVNRQVSAAARAAGHLRERGGRPGARHGVSRWRRAPARRDDGDLDGRSCAGAGGTAA